MFRDAAALMRKVAAAIAAVLLLFLAVAAHAAPGGGQRLRRGVNINVVFDGNSLMAGTGAVTDLYGKHDMPTQVMALLGGSLKGVVAWQNFGIPSQTWRMMDGLDSGSSADVDGAYLPGWTNVLVAWETTNTILANRTPGQAASDAQLYIQHRLAANPGWLIVIVSTLPRQGWSTSGQTVIDTNNANLLAADAIIRASYRGWGVKAFVDVRMPGSPFRFADFSQTSFGRDPQLWNSAETNSTSNGYIHLSAAGYSVIAQIVARAIVGLPNR